MSEAMNALYEDWYDMSVEVDRYLTDAEVDMVVGCVGYAFRQVLAGESADLLGDGRSQSGTTIIISYDSTKSQRDDPDFLEAFNLAQQYIQFGTPVRKTNRSGPGTAGTPLLAGIGECRVALFVGDQFILGQRAMASRPDVVALDAHGEAAVAAWGIE